MNGIQDTLARGAGLGLMIGIPMLGHATPDHASVTRQLGLPLGWVFDVGSGTSPASGTVEALVQSGRVFTDYTMIDVRLVSGLKAGTTPTIPARSAASLVDQYAPFISRQDAAIVRALAGSMSSTHGDPSRNLIYESY